MTTQDFPDNFDVRNDSVFQERIKPFIEDHLKKLEQFDADRAAWAEENLPSEYEITYIFHEHTYRVAKDMRKTAAHMGLPDHVCENLYWAMLAHDIGKSYLPVYIWDILEKPEDNIKRLRRSHTEVGVQVVNETLDFEYPFIDLMTDIMLNHHEQMDGKGYRGIPGTQLSTPVRLACIIESFDGYSIHRPHFGDRDISVQSVLKRMREEKGSDIYDMVLFEEFAGMKTKDK